MVEKSANEKVTITLSSNLLHALIFVAIFFACLFLSLDRHKDHDPYTYLSEIWSDKAGYYSYLPGAFIYGFDASQLPVDQPQIGMGFEVDTVNNIIRTKYTCGTAIMESPFFLGAHIIASNSDDYKADGYSKPYRKAINVAAVFYFVLGLVFLRLFLLQYFKPKTVWLLLAVLFLCTNLYYYAIDETGMSHIYSFFLVSTFLYALQKFLSRKEFKWWVVVSITLSMIVLVRPTNLIFGTALLFLDLKSLREIQSRIMTYVDLKLLGTAALIAILIWIPQFAYWKYAYGSFVSYSYEGEGFPYVFSPHLWKIWFSPINGWFIFTPLALLMVAGLVYMLVNRIANGWWILAITLIMSWVWASWHMWHFGCSFGYRNFVEFYPLLVLPLGYIAKELLDNRRWILGSLSIVFVFLCFAYNFHLIRVIKDCFFREDWWAWEDFAYVVQTDLPYPLFLERGDTLITFDETAFEKRKDNVESEFAISGDRVCHLREGVIYGAGYEADITEVLGKSPRRLRIEVALRKTKVTGNVKLVANVDSAGTNLYWNAHALNEKIPRANEWFHDRDYFWFPRKFGKGSVLKVYAWNEEGGELMLEDLRIIFE